MTWWDIKTKLLNATLGIWDVKLSLRDKIEIQDEIKCPEKEIKSLRKEIKMETLW